MSDDLLDSIALRRAKRPRGPGMDENFSLVYVRDLDLGDKAELENPVPGINSKGYNTQNGQGLQRIRHTHHLLAMALAEGASVERAAALTGYAPGTIRDLQRDPKLQELIVHYRSATMAEFEEVRARAASLGLSFLDELQARLEEAPESFANKDVLEAATKLLDRTILPSKVAGSGPGQGPGGAQPAGVMRIEFVDARNLPQSQGQSPAPNPRVVEGQATPSIQIEDAEIIEETVLIPSLSRRREAE